MRLRLTVLFCALLLAGGLLSATEVPPDRSGDYVIYRDYSWKSPTWIGFLFYDQNTWGAFLHTPETNTRVSILFRVEPVDNRLVLTGQNIISEITNDDVPAVNYLMGLLPDLYVWRKVAANTMAASFLPQRRGALLPAESVWNLNRPEFGGDVVLRYAAWVPLFNLRALEGASGSAMLTLERVGRIRADEEQTFFGFEPLTPSSAAPGSVLPRRRDSEKKTVDGIELSLDGQWTMIADNTFLMGDTAVLVVDTVDFPALGLSAAALPLELARLFALSNAASVSLPTALEVTGNARKYRVSNLFQDRENGALTRDIKTVIPQRDGRSIVISLSVNESVYQANQRYFNSLF